MNEQKMIRRIIIVTLLIILSIGNSLIFADEILMDDYVVEEPIIEKARVLEISVIEDATLENDFIVENFLVTLRVLTGKYKGQEFQTIHSLTGNIGYDIRVEPGDRVLVTIEDSQDEGVAVHISEYLRDTYIYLVFTIFIVLLILVGGYKGISTIITLALTMIMVLKILLPGLLAGYNPIFLTIFVSFVITLVTIIIVGGNNAKSYAAIIGTLGGVFISGIIAYFIGTKVKLTGLSSDEAMMLMFIPQGVKFDFRGLLFAGIIMGALGAVMDVGMSIASSMEEIKNANPLISRKNLIIAGMNVGKDVMGTMANTLILAYTGSAIPLLLVFTAYKESLRNIINLDIIATEIIRAFSGSIGLVLCIPLTAVTTGFLIDRFAKRDSGGNSSESL